MRRSEAPQPLCLRYSEMTRQVSPPQLNNQRLALRSSKLQLIKPTEGGGQTQPSG